MEKRERGTIRTVKPLGVSEVRLKNMDCAWKGRGTRCVGRPKRLCSRCGAVAYCSVSHQISHRREHKEECERLKQHMKQMDVLNEFPFTFSEESTVQVCERKETRCTFMRKRGIHQSGMWSYECECRPMIKSFDCTRLINGWDLPDILCPCNEPLSTISKCLSNWKKYYKWRSIPFNSPVALLLHWPLTIYHVIQIAGLGCQTSETSRHLCIHYLGPEKELQQLAVFAELRALFPDVHVHIELIGPSVPQRRDGERIELCKYAHCTKKDCICKSLNESISCHLHNCKTPAVTLQLRRGFYHERYRDIAKDSSPNLIIAPNAGIAAYSSWLPTIELIKNINLRAVFSDYCEEACNLGARCISSVTGSPLALPIQLNPFRQPIVVEDSALFIRLIEAPKGKFVVTKAKVITQEQCPVILRDCNLVYDSSSYWDAFMAEKEIILVDTVIRIDYGDMGGGFFK